MLRDDNDELVEERDTKCARAQSGPCRSGMPFYRVKVTSKPIQECSSFCISKGLDLFALLGYECRCGATQSNAAVWGKSWFAVHEGLALDLSTASAARGRDPSECDSMSVFRYTAWMSAPAGKGLFERSEEDSAYVDSIVNGWADTA